MKITQSVLLLALVASPLIAAAAPKAAKPAKKDEKEVVGEVIDTFHAAASAHKEDLYFAMFTADGVFLGTDPKERWTRDEFRKWAHPIFAKGKGWTIESHRRHVFLSADKRVAWFDEEAESKELGPVRGSGVLVKEKGLWKVAQYNLSVPLLNEQFDQIRKLNVAAPTER